MARHSLACSCPSVFSRLKFQTVLHVYIAGEIHALGFRRRGHPGVFFKHENQKYPPALSSSGKLKQGENQIQLDASRLREIQLSRIPRMWK